MAAFINLLILVLQFYSFILLARVLISWFPNVDYSNPVIRFLYEITEPVLAPVRELLRQAMPQSGGMMMDFSPLIVFILIRVIIILMVNTF